jgi:hypothetical protein
MATKIDNRQSRQRSALDQLSNSTNLRLDNILNLMNDELQMPLRMRATATPNQVLNIDPITVQTLDSGEGHGRRRTIPPISNLLPTFTGATITFPTSSGGSITTTGTFSGGPYTLTVASGNWIKVMIALTSDGKLLLTFGTEGASEAAAGLPGTSSGTFAIGYVAMQNTAGTIQTVTDLRIYQFVGGGGSGSGGSGNELLESLRNMLDDSSYEMLSSNIFSTDQQTQIATLGGTATFSLVDSAVTFAAASDSVTSTDHLDPDFLAASLDVTSASLVAYWKSGAVDPAATYQISRDGGSHYQTMTMSRIGSTTVGFQGEYNWTREEEDAFSDTFSTTSSNTEFTNVAGTKEALGQRFVLSAQTHITSIGLYLSKVGSPTGTYTFKLVGDNGANNVQELVLYFQSAAQNVSSLTGSAALVSVACDVDLPAGTYHVVAVTDGTYKNAYVASTTAMRLHGAAASPTGDFFNDSVWAGEATLKYAYAVSGGTESFASVSTYAVANADATVTLNASTQQQLSQAFTLASAYSVKRLQLYLNRASSASVGNFYAQIVRDSAGSPSLVASDVLAESSAVLISGLGTGNVTASVTMPKTALPAGTYHLVLRTDATYKAGTMDLAWRDDTSSPPAPNGKRSDGTSYSALGTAGTFTYLAEGRILDLRVKITASAASTLTGYGAYYQKQTSGVNSGIKKVQSFPFMSNTGNLNSFALNWVPDPDLLKCYYVEAGQVFMYPAFSINGSTITFPVNTFQQVTDQAVTLKFVQTEGYTFDNSSQNAASIAALQTSVTAMGNATTDQVVVNYLTAVNGTPAAGQFRSTITGRAKMVDLSTDLCTRMGVERIQIQSIMRVDGEVGPSGEAVYKPVNDKYDQVRMSGGWTSQNSINGVYVQSSTTTDALEVVFYGTGFNILHCYLDSASRGFTSYTLDGGGSVSLTAIVSSSTLNGRNYPSNHVQNIVSGLTLGLHTIRLVGQANGAFLSGFEILNESASVKVNPGVAYKAGAKLTLASQHSSAYNSSFESGVLGTRGGRVLVYQKADGTIAKAVMPAASASATFNSANHDAANEEVIRNYFWREFGAGRSDDFSTLTNSPGSKTFTLDDGTTTLTGDSVLNEVTGGGPEGVRAAGNGNYLTLTFVGTGLDIIKSDTATGGGDTFAFTVDGGSAVTYSTTGVGTSPQVVKIVSGLPYGTHIVKFSRTSAPSVYHLKHLNFIVYGPKKPTLPTGAVEIADYNILADYVANTVAGGETIGTGILRKESWHEFTYVGTWSTPALNPGGAGGQYVQTTTTGTAGASPTGTYAQYTFWGTGFDFRLYGGSPTFAMSLTDIAAGTTMTNFTGFGAGAYGGHAFTMASGTGTANNVQGGISISGLPLKLYRMTIAATSASGLNLQTMDIITPIHVHKLNGPHTIQNTLSVGSQGINDSRSFGSQLNVVKKHNKTIAMQNSSTTSSVFVPILDMLSTVALEKDSRVMIVLDLQLANTNTGQNSFFGLMVNGSLTAKMKFNADLGSNYAPYSITRTLTLPKGTHTVNAVWLLSGAGSISNTQSVDEERSALTIAVLD